MSIRIMNAELRDWCLAFGNHAPESRQTGGMGALLLRQGFGGQVRSAFAVDIILPAWLSSGRWAALRMTMKCIAMIGLMAVLVAGCGHQGGDTEQERRQTEDKRRQVEDQQRRVEDDRRKVEDERRRVEDERRKVEDDRRRAMDAALEAARSNGEAKKT